MLPLFSYGTLRDPELQEALFDRTFTTAAATLHGYVIVSTGTYLTATKHPGGFIRGALVRLDEEGYRIADRWENLEVYVRKEAVALDEAGNRVPCFFYLRPDMQGAIVTDERLSDLPREQMLAEIRAFRAQISER